LWREARNRNGFALFTLALEELAEIRLEQACQLLPAGAPGLSRWEVLAQPFEPDVRSHRLDEQPFAPLAREIPQLLDTARGIAAKPPASMLPPAD